jgi:hypothetical protein
MRSKLLIGGLLASVMIIPALAQSNTTAATAAAETSTPAATHSDMWRSSKLIGGKEVLRGPTIAKQPSF